MHDIEIPDWVKTPEQAAAHARGKKLVRPRHRSHAGGRWHHYKKAAAYYGRQGRH